MKTIRLLTLALLTLLLRAQTIYTATLDVGSGGNVGQFTSQATVTGNPASADCNVSDTNLKFARKSADVAAGKPQQLTSPDQVPEGLAKLDWASIRAAYEAGRHTFQPVEGGWQARNPGQQWLTRFDGRGFVAEPTGGGWQWGLQLKSYGFAGHEHAISGRPSVKANDQRLTYQWDAAVQEWFVNDARGLEHGFIVRERPTPSADTTAPLQFDLAVRGSLTAQVALDGQGVEFCDASGAVVLHYAGLKVWDADGKVLPACFTPTLASAPGTLRLLLEESGARYPITVDPIAQQAYLKASNTGASDHFGFSVAVFGDTVVVGASGEAGSGTGVNPADNNGFFGAGAAYVFVRSGTTWTQQAYLKASNTGSDSFGSSVAVSGDTVVVGAYFEQSNATGVNGNGADNSASGSGAAYVFTRSGTTWTQQAYLKASNTGSSDYFGFSVAVSGDTVVVGASGEDSNAIGVNGNQADDSFSDSGAAYVFTRSGMTWSQQAYLKASNTGAGDRFGFSVAVSGDTVVVGAEEEDSNATGLNGNQTDNSFSDSGAAYVFTRSGTTWSQQAYLKASNTGTDDRFGEAVAVSGDTVVVGAFFEDGSGTGVNPVDNNGADVSGAAYVFVRSGTTWSQQAYLKASNTGTDDRFGDSVAVSGDTVVVGASQEGGSGTGVNPVSDNLAIDSGAAYVFVRSGTTWSQQAYLKASNTGGGDDFGYSVAVSGDTVVVGAFLEDSGGTGVNPVSNNSASDAGASYVFVGLGPAQEIAVEHPAGTDLTDGTSSIAFGNVNVGSSSAATTFTIKNIGPVALTISSVTVTGGNAGDFNVDTTGMLTSVPATIGSTTFTASFTPSVAGTRSTTLRIVSDDYDETSFDIVIMGTGNTVPTLSLPASPVIVEATSANGAAVTFTVSASDDLDGTLTATPDHASGSTFAIGDTTVNVSATDSGGLTTSGSFIVRVVDTTAPVVAAHGNVTMEATSAAGAVVNYAAGSATDAVTAGPTITYSQNSGTVFPLGTTTVTITAKDAANNTGTGTFTVTVSDTTAPAVAAHANVTVEATSAAGAVVTYAAGSATDAVTASPTITYSKNSGTIFALGTTTVTITAKDAANNTGTGTFTVTVQDTTKPTLTLPSNITTEATSASGRVVSFSVSASDTVSGSLTPTVNPPSGSTFSLGTTTVNVSATDGAGNTQTGDFTVTVQDTTAPVVAAHANVIAEATSAAGATVNYGAATATDAVTASPTITYSQNSGTTFPLGVTTVTITATDAANNSGTRTFTVIVQDTTAPVVAAHGNVTMEATSAAGAVVTYTAGSATDAVTASPTITYSQNSGTTFPLGVTTVTITAKDAVNNTGTGAFTVTVNDTTAPVIVPHSNVTAEATSATGAVVTYAVGSATDAVTTSPTITYSKNSGTTFPLGVTTVTITAKDVANNTGTSTFTVTVQDTTAPVVAAHANVTVEATSAAGATVNYATATATDAVTTSPTITYSQNSGTTFPLGVTTVTITATDAANNRGAGTFTITVRDTTKPTLTLPSNMILEATAASGVVVSFSVSASDTVSGALTPSVNPPSGSTFALGITTVNISATDGAGNTKTGSFTVTVRDTTKPTLTLPSNMILEATAASGVVAGFSVSASDTVSGALTPSVNPPSGSTFALGITTVNVLATDGAGNVQTGSFTVTVQDTTKPALTLPADIIAEATGANGAVVSFGVIASDAVSGAVVPMVSPASGSVFPLGTTTVNVSATDGAGNVQSGSFTVTVRDTTKPVIAPGPIVAEASSAAGAVVNFTAATDTVSTPMVEATPASGSVFLLGETTVAVTATDAAGNVAMGSFVVRVRDTTLPILTVPGAITAEASSASGAVVNFSPTATDTVSAPVVASVPGSGSTFPIGATMVNVTATDAEGNVGHGSFSVTVRDTTAPTIGGLRDRTTSVTKLPDFTDLPVTSDLVGVSSVTQAPLQGSALALGATVVTLTAHDAAGNTADTNFTLTRYPADPAHKARYASGDPVPGAETLGGAPAGATFTMFGVPAINDAGDVAFTAKWTSPLGPGEGVFAGAPVVLVTQVGGQAPGLGGTTFKAMADPVLDAAGRIAFLATLGGAAKGEDTVLMTYAPGGSLEAVAREGGTVNGPGSPQIKAFGDVSLVDGEVLFTAKLEGGAPAVRAVNDAAAFRITGSGLEPVVREGDPLGGSTVKAFKLLGVVGGSPGQSRGHTGKGTASFLALLADGTQALVDSTGGVLTDFVATGDAPGGMTLPGATFKSFGAVAAEADRAAFLATLNWGGAVTAVNGRGIFLGAGTAFKPIARVTDPVTDLPGASFKAFLDPVLAPGANAVAFAAMLRGAGIGRANDGAVFYRPDGGTLRAIAREGGQPPGAPSGAKWKSFTSLAIPGGSTGPLFRATLVRGAGEVNATNDAGVWAVDSTGALRLLFREGELVGDRTVKTFTVLNAVRGSTGVTRAFNNAALVVWRANFADGSTAIVVTSVP